MTKAPSQFPGITDLPDKFDVVIPAAKKDFTKLPFAVDLLYQNVPVKDVYIVSPEPVYKEEAAKLAEHDVIFLNDQDVLPIDLSIFQVRPAWVYAQLIKLQIMQNITETEWYLSVDGDLFALKPLPFVVHGKPGLFYARDKNKTILAYGKFTHRLLGFPWNKFSLMNDIALYNKAVIVAMIDHVGGHDAFISKTADICKASCLLADTQLYYSWAQREFPDLYDVRTVSNQCADMSGSYEYPPDKVEEAIANSISVGKVDTLSLHSWT